jgi:hypothetical protein
MIEGLAISTRVILEFFYSAACTTINEESF